jgi:GT2 family glycosyltransferase
MPNPDPRVVVLIATRNRLASLRTTLAHLLALPERPRVVLADNGSTDGTPESIRVEFPGVEVLPIGENLGAAARNIAARHVAVPFVAFADDDSWWAPGSLGRAGDILETYPRVALLAARVLVGPEGRLDPTCEAMASSPLPRPEGEALPGPPVLGFLACGAVVRREAFLAAGGFPARYGVGGEEEPLAIDLAAAGWRLCYVDALIAHHHPSPTRDPAARRRVQLRNALWTAWMRRPLRSALARTARLLRGPAAVPGLLDALRGLGPTLRDRRVVGPELERALRRLED